MKKLLCIESSVNLFTKGDIYLRNGLVEANDGGRYGGWWVDDKHFSVGFAVGEDAIFIEMPKKSPVKMLNRAFRKATPHWLGHPNGFKSKKDHRAWCREQALWLYETDALNHVYGEHGELYQIDVDDVVSDEISYWYE